MTPDQMQERERHTALMAVAHALTADERAQFLAKTSRWRGMDGAEVADILDLTVEHDEFLGQTEPFFTEHDAMMPDGLNYAPLYAAHALIILDQRLTYGRVMKLLFRAGVLDTEHEAQVRNFIVEEVAGEMARAWDLNYCTEAGAPKLGRLDALSMARHAMSRLSVIRDRDHIDPLS
jgi:hypothetical protein